MASSGDHDDAGVAVDNKILTRLSDSTHTELAHVGGRAGTPNSDSDDGGLFPDLGKVLTNKRFRNSTDKSHSNAADQLDGNSHDGVETRSQNAAPAPLHDDAPKRRAQTSNTIHNISLRRSQIEHKSKRKKGEGGNDDDREQGEGKGKKKNARCEGAHCAPTKSLKDERSAVRQDPSTTHTFYHSSLISSDPSPSTNIGSTHPHVFHKDPFVESPSSPSSNRVSHVPHASSRSRHDDSDNDNDNNGGSKGTSNVHSSHLSGASSFLSGAFTITPERKASSSKQLPKAFMQLEQKGLFQGVIKGEQTDPSWDRSHRKLLYGLPKLVWVILADVLAMTVFLTCIPVVLSCAKRRRPLFR